MAERSHLVRRRTRTWRSRWRQWRHWPQVRIAEPAFAADQRDELEELLALIAQLEQPVVDEVADSNDGQALAEAATSLWRAQRKLAQGSKSTEGRQAGRYLRTCAEALAEAGLVVQDHDGTAFNAGRALDVLVYEDDPAVTEETITETVRPSVYYQDQQIQRGEVIVARPVPTATTWTTTSTVAEPTRVGDDDA